MTNSQQKHNQIRERHLQQGTHYAYQVYTLGGTRVSTRVYPRCMSEYDPKTLGVQPGYPRVFIPSHLARSKLEILNKKLTNYWNGVFSRVCIYTKCILCGVPEGTLEYTRAYARVRSETLRVKPGHLKSIQTPLEYCCTLAHLPGLNPRNSRHFVCIGGRRTLHATRKGSL